MHTLQYVNKLNYFVDWVLIDVECLNRCRYFKKIEKKMLNNYIIDFPVNIYLYMYFCVLIRRP